MSALYAAAGAAGIGTAAAVLAFFMLSNRPRAPAKPAGSPAPVKRKKLEAHQLIQKSSPAKTYAPLLAGAALAGSFTWGTDAFLPSLWIGGLLGHVAVTMSKRIVASKKKFARLKEVAVLYESTDLFMKAGFSTWQSLQMSVTLISVIRPAVEDCLNNWSFGPMRAIRQMGEDIGIPEAQVLIGILMHAAEGGVEKTAGIMAEEAARLEEIRKSLAETRIAAKPIYAAVYRFLPLTASMGMLLGPLAYSAVTMLSGMRFQ